MDKKSIVNILFQVAVISVFAIGYSMLGTKILKMTPLSIQKFDLEDTGKLVAIVAVSEMQKSILLKRRSYQNTSTFKNGECSNVDRRCISKHSCFTGSSYSFSKLSEDSTDKERKRHDLATEQLQKDQIEWAQTRQQRIDFINKQLRLE